MNKWLLTCTLIIGLAACKDQTSKEPQAAEVPEEEETEVIDTLVSDETIQRFHTMGFTDYVKKKAPAFDWSRFHMTSTWTDTPLVTEFTPDASFFKNYGSFLKYSPDSSFFIDLDSYNIDIVKDSKGNFTGKEMGPDTEISLVNSKTKEKTRLLFMGPGGSVEDGIWLDNNTLVLVGVQDNGEQQRTASLWRYDVPTHTFFVYESQDTTLATSLPGYWREERLRRVKIQ